ncbi:uncharacterized protein [Prorops nasuta]|uniref:uncharacterized protein n=1 Tax=Prorops nasuta TaxID=863751 RepID=UPI0034CE5527
MEINTVESLFNDGSENICDTNGTKTWSKDNILFLINAMKELDEEYSNGTKILVYKKIEKQFREIGENINAKTVEIKWKGLLKTYKTIKNNNQTSGAKRRFWEYYNLLNDFMQTKPEIVPVASYSSSSGLKVNRDNLNEQSEEPVKKKTKMCDKERRHQEKMDRMDKFNQLFAKMVEKM